MELLISVVLMTIGLLFLYKGGDLFTEACIYITGVLPISPIVTGATIVSMANALPDFLVSFNAAVEGHYDMSIGNSLGAVICNLGLIIGLTNLIHPSAIRSRFFDIKASIMLLSGFVLFFMSRDSVLGDTDAWVLLLLFIFYMMFSISVIKWKTNSFLLSTVSKKKLAPEMRINILYFLFGLVLLWTGSALICKYGISLSQILGISERTIALSLVAFGTSLPEMTTTIIASKKGYFSIALGNIIGTNILNILMVLGVSSAFRPLSVNHTILSLDIPFLIVLMALFTIPTILQKRITRSLAFTLLLMYFIHLAVLWGFHG